MSKCETCKRKRSCVANADYPLCYEPTKKSQPPTPITQGDRIRRMDNRELAKQFVYFDVSTNRIRTLHTPSSYLKIEDAIDAEECWLSLPVEGEQK